MRIDKFLKVSRILKRRVVSKELALHNRLEINGKIAKASSTVKVGDIITVLYGNHELKVKVNELLTTTKKQDAALMYEVVEERWLEKKIVEDNNT